MIKEISIGTGSIGYSVSEEESYVKIEYYRGKDISISVPERIEEKAVKIIGKKAFLGAKTLTSITICDCVEEIGDWAFAACSGLKELIIPFHEMKVGNGLFKDCKNLQRIMLYNVTDSFGLADDLGDIAYLLASAVTGLDAQYLFDLSNVGTADWINQYDNALRQFLSKDDSEGFSKMLLCGEEDYVGDDSNLDTYQLLRKKEKVRLIMLRLLHDIGINDNDRKLFAEYLNRYMSEVTWNVVLTEHGNDQEYFDLLIKYECINKENISQLIEQMGDRNTQMKGYLLKVKGEKFGAYADDFFDGLEL